MPSIKLSKKLPFSQKELFDIVSDVENYPQIVGYIDNITIKERQKFERNSQSQNSDLYGISGNADEQINCNVSVSLGGPIKFSYECTVDLYKYHKINIKGTKGAFRTLNSRWSFVPSEDNPEETHIAYYLDFSFRSKIMAKAASLIFAQQMQSTIDSFERYLYKIKSSGG